MRKTLRLMSAGYMTTEPCASYDSVLFYGYVLLLLAKIGPTCRFEEINLMKKKIRESLFSASSFNWISLSLTSGYICIYFCFQVLNLFFADGGEGFKVKLKTMELSTLSIAHVLLAIVQRWPPCCTMFSSSSCGIILYSHRSRFMNLFCCFFGELICRFDNGARVCGQVCTQCVNS